MVEDRIHDGPAGPTPALYFSLGGLVPYALTRDADGGGVKGPRGFTTYHEAMEASRFLNLLRRPKLELHGQP